MIAFTTLTAPAACMPERDIDTDIIFPARFLLHTQKAGLGQYAFHDKRGLPGFSLDDDIGAGARILITGDNFGCGSSREQAAWAIHDLGLRVVIGPSFGEIFFTNCFKNGMLPIVASPEDIALFLTAAQAGEVFTVDLQTQTVTMSMSGATSFQVDPAQREALLNGWDEIALIRARHAASIDRFEQRQRKESPWLWPESTSVHQ